MRILNYDVYCTIVVYDGTGRQEKMTIQTGYFRVMTRDCKRAHNNKKNLWVGFRYDTETFESGNLIG